MSNAAARPPRLIVGLGNPGAEYSETRHNAGFWFCERLADQLGVRFSHESRFHGLVANAREAGMWLLMPQTFMNRSGQAIGALARFYRIEPAEIVTVVGPNGSGKSTLVRALLGHVPAETGRVERLPGLRIGERLDRRRSRLTGRPYPARRDHRRDPARLAPRADRRQSDLRAPPARAVGGARSAHRQRDPQHRRRQRPFSSRRLR